MENSNPVTVRVTDKEIEAIRERLDSKTTYNKYGMSPGRVIRSFLWQELSKPFNSNSDSV